MIRQMSVLLCVFCGTQGMLRRELTQAACSSRESSPEAPVTPLSPMSSANLSRRSSSSLLRQTFESSWSQEDYFWDCIITDNVPGIERVCTEDVINEKREVGMVRQTPIIYALRRGRIAAFKKLVELNADLTIPDSNQCTVTMYALMYARKHRGAPLAILEQHGILDCTVPRDENNRTALWHMVNKKTMPTDKDGYAYVLDFVRMLVGSDFAIDPHEKDRFDVSAVDLAIEVYGPRAEIVKILKREV